MGSRSSNLFAIRVIGICFLVMMSLEVRAAGASTCNDFYRTTCDAKQRQTSAALSATQTPLRNQWRDELGKILGQRPGLVAAGLDAIGIRDSFAPCRGDLIREPSCTQAYRELMVDYAVLQKTSQGESKPLEDFYAKHFSGGEQPYFMQFSRAVGPLREQGFSFTFNSADSSEANQYTQGELNVVFQDAMTSVSAVIQRLPISMAAKEELAKRVSRVQLKQDVGSPTALNRYLGTTASYSPITNLVQLSGAYISKETPREAILAVLAHEIGHSLDPCNLGFTAPEGAATNLGLAVPEPFLGRSLDASDARFQSLDKWYPLGRVSSCLRQENSIRARPPLPMSNLTDARILRRSGKGTQNYSGQASPGQSPAHAAACGAGHGSGSCKDQISEAMADWISAEALVEKKRRTSDFNVRAALTGMAETFCVPEFDREVVDSRFNIPTDSHSLGDRRFSHLFLAHPLLRSQIGCEANEAQYCDGSTAFTRYPDFAADRWPSNHLSSYVRLATPATTEAVSAPAGKPERPKSLSGSSK